MPLSGFEGIYAGDTGRQKNGWASSAAMAVERDSVLVSSIRNYLEMDSQETFTLSRFIQGYQYATYAPCIQSL